MLAKSKKLRLCGCTFESVALIPAPETTFEAIILGFLPVNLSTLSIALVPQSDQYAKIFFLV